MRQHERVFRCTAARRTFIAAACLLTLLGAGVVPPALALDEAERLYFVGERALADNLLPFGVQMLERFVSEFPADKRVPQALMAIARTRLALGDKDAALAAFRRAQKVAPPAVGLEARFWEAEVLFRLEKYAEAGAAYKDVVRGNPAAAFAPDALYSYGFTELKLKRPEPAAAAFREFLKACPDHALAPTATYQLGRALVELEKFGDAVTPLATFVTKYPDHKLIADARYLLGWARTSSGDDKAGLAELKAFVSRHPSHPLAADARKVITDLSARVGDASDLHEAYVALMKETPATAETLIAAIGVAAKLGRTRDQELAWRKLKASFPEHPLTAKLAFDLAASAYKRKDWAQVATLADAAARVEDDAVKAEALLLAGEAEVKLRRFAAAAKAFEAVTVLRKVDGTLRYRALAELGMVREGQKNPRAAIAAYELVANDSPDPALRDWARERAEALRARLEQTPAASPSTKPGKSS